MHACLDCMQGRTVTMQLVPGTAGGALGPIHEASSSICLPACLPACLPVCLSSLLLCLCLPVYACMCASVFANLSVCLFMHLLVCLPLLISLPFWAIFACIQVSLDPRS